ncbi:hypothetical protein AAMO2058_001133000 [Amorphochlora amoebiformis]
MTPLLLSLFIIPLCTSIDQKSIVFGAKNAENSGNNLRIFPHVVNGHGMGLSGHASGALGGRGTQGEEGQGPHPGGGPKDPGDNGNNGGSGNDEREDAVVIATSVVGALIGLALIIFGVIKCYCHRRVVHQREEVQNHTAGEWAPEYAPEREVVDVISVSVSVEDDPKAPSLSMERRQSGLVLYKTNDQPQSGTRESDRRRMSHSGISGMSEV